MVVDVVAALPRAPRLACPSTSTLNFCPLLFLFAGLWLLGFGEALLLLLISVSCPRAANLVDSAVPPSF